MKNCRRGLGSESEAESVTNVGEVKMNSSSPIRSSSSLSASKAKIENVVAAIRSLDPRIISDFKSSPSRSLTLSMILMG